MPNYTRIFLKGGSYFLSVVNCKRSPILKEETNIDLVSCCSQSTIEKYPFTVDPFVILPDHSYASWTLPDDESDFSIHGKSNQRTFSHYYSGSKAAAPDDWINTFWTGCACSTGSSRLYPRFPPPVGYRMEVADAVQNGTWSWCMGNSEGVIEPFPQVATGKWIQPKLCIDYATPFPVGAITYWTSVKSPIEWKHSNFRRFIEKAFHHIDSGSEVDRKVVWMNIE